MILAIDAGNSRIKWGCFENGRWSITGAVEHDEIDSLESMFREFEKPSKIVVSNVAGPDVAQKIADAIAKFSIGPLWPRPDKNGGGVFNGYADSNKLGSDRWAALIGARREQSGPVLVVNAGTALTIDAMTPSGEFLGGLIVPGVRLMMQSLTQGTAHARASHGEFSVFPTNTRDAIYSGALNAALGAIERMRAALGRHTNQLAACIVSGGAAAVLLPHLSPPIREVPHLVLLGLVTIAEATN
jgi:type III pantothenate kinase